MVVSRFCYVFGFFDRTQFLNSYCEFRRVKREKEIVCEGCKNPNDSNSKSTVAHVLEIVPQNHWFTNSHVICTICADCRNMHSGGSLWMYMFCIVDLDKSRPDWRTFSYAIETSILWRTLKTKTHKDSLTLWASIAEMFNRMKIRIHKMFLFLSSLIYL